MRRCSYDDNCCDVGWVGLEGWGVVGGGGGVRIECTGNRCGSRIPQRFLCQLTGRSDDFSLHLRYLVRTTIVQIFQFTLVLPRSDEECLVITQRP